MGQKSLKKMKKRQLQSKNPEGRKVEARRAIEARVCQNWSLRIYGFGFVFSKEDNDSSLASFIPGLQRLGKNKDVGEEEKGTSDSPVDSEPKVSEPCLSEAWEVLDSMRENPLTNWRIPTLSNEIDMKDNLRWWANTFAVTFSLPSFEPSSSKAL